MNFRVLVLILACIGIGIAIGMVAMQREWLDWIVEHLPFLLAVIILSAFVLALAGWLAYLILRWWIRHKLGIKGDLNGEEIVVGLADKLTNRNELQAPDVQDRLHSLVVNLGLYYVRSVAMQRYFLLIGGTFTVLIGMATVFLLYEQNRKLDIQTEQIRIQSQANTVASLLMEGTRRAALSAEQTALFADIRTEAAAIRMDDAGKAERKCPDSERAYCWREVELPDKTKIELVHLSDDLFQRVRAYALRASPYPIANRKPGSTDRIDITKPLEGQFYFPELSPERGQLLQTLALNKVDVEGITFHGADLKSLDLSRADLREANLREANLAEANLFGANLIGANLTGAILTGANLTEATLFRADLREANLEGADLRVAYLSEADLSEADLTKANFTGADLTKADLTLASFTGVVLVEADLTGANLIEASFLPLTNDGRREALDIWRDELPVLSRGLDKANLPKGFTASCTVPVEVDESGIRGNSCPAEGGWTITYNDQPEFAPQPGEAATEE